MYFKVFTIFFNVFRNKFVVRCVPYSNIHACIWDTGKYSYSYSNTLKSVNDLQLQPALFGNDIEVESVVVAVI